MAYTSRAPLGALRRVAGHEREPRHARGAAVSVAVGRLVLGDDAAEPQPVAVVLEAVDEARRADPIGDEPVEVDVGGDELRLPHEALVDSASRLPFSATIA